MQPCLVANRGCAHATEGDHPACTSEARKVGDTVAGARGEAPGKTTEVIGSLPMSCHAGMRACRHVVCWGRCGYPRWKGLLSKPAAICACRSRGGMRTGERLFPARNQKTKSKNPVIGIRPSHFRYAVLAPKFSLLFCKKHTSFRELF